MVFHIIEDLLTMTTEERIDALEKQCHFFHMKVEKMTHLFGPVQEHELRIYGLEHDDGIVKGKAKQVRIDDLKVGQLRGQ
jgi:hypothetical protein